MVEEEVSREEAMQYLSNAPTDPSTLVWKPVLRIFKGYLRLRMKVTPQNVSPELLDAYRTFVYPEEDPPEIKGLMARLGHALSKASLPCEITRGPGGLQQGAVGYFEPYKFKMPLAEGELSMAIALTEIQWILRRINKEPPQMLDRIETFKRALLEETRAWLRRGNR